MTTLYVEKARLEKLVVEREAEKRWWFAHPSSLDQPPEPYVAGHQWAAEEATWGDLENSFVALFAVTRASLQVASPLNEAIGTFVLAAAQRGLLDASKAYAALSEEDLRSLRLFIQGAHGVALLVLKHANWTVADVR